MAFLALLTVGVFGSPQPESAAEPSTLRVMLDRDLSILDPCWTTAHVTRNHGYLVYDTLFPRLVLYLVNSSLIP